MNVLLLALLHAAAEQDHEVLPIFAEIDAVAWAEIDAALKHS